MDTAELLRLLACPRCLGDLEALDCDGATAGFACAACQVVYPVRDDIPVMLVEEAIPREVWDSRPRTPESGAHPGGNH